MTERAAIVAAIRANPDDDFPKLAYADFLEDHGEPERAELIRVTAEMARLNREWLAETPPPNAGPEWVLAAWARSEERAGVSAALNRRLDALRPWMNDYPPPIPGAVVVWRSSRPTAQPSPGSVTTVVYYQGLAWVVRCTKEQWHNHGPALMETDPCRHVVDIDPDGFTRAVAGILSDAADDFADDIRRAAWVSTDLFPTALPPPYRPR